jgi:hypothetical protein
MPEVPAQNKDKVDQVVNLLGGLPPEPASGDAATLPDTETGDGFSTEAGSAIQPPQGDQPGTDDLTPASLAEKLGVKPSELFTRLRIPIDGADDLTLEEFKSAGKELRSVRKARDELAEQRVTFENEVMVQRQTLDAAIAQIPAGSLTPEMIQATQAKRAANVDAERRQLFTIRPDLRDAGKWGAMRDILVAHMRPYGFSPSEVDQIVDHRAAKYVIDNAERELRIKALEKDGLAPKKRAVADPSPKPAVKSSRRKKADAVVRGTRATTAKDKTAAVAALIGET